MAKRAAQPASNSADRGTSPTANTPALLGAGAWLIAYLAVFLGLPVPEFDGARRGEILLVAVLRPDDLVSGWFEGFTWQSLAERGWILLVALGVLSVAASAGWLLLRLLRIDRAVTRPEMTLLAIVAGANVESLVTLALGLIGLLRADLFLALGLVACIAAAAFRRVGGCESGTCAVAIEGRADAAWSWSPHWLWVLVPFTLALVGSGMLPPLDFDVREYHLQAPKEFYQAGRIGFLPHNVYANMPLGSEMLALAAMAGCGDWWMGALAGKTLIALFTPLTALLLYSVGCRFASPASGIVAALVYISIPWVAIVSTHGLVEGVFACYLLAAFYVALIWRSSLRAEQSSAAQRTTRRGLLLLSGFLAGGAVSTKYPAVVYCALPLLALVAYAGWRRLGAAGAARAVAVVALGLAVGCGLWFAKNTAATGNPTYPLLYSVFGGETRTPDMAAQWHAAHRPPNFEPADLAERAWTLVLTSAWISPLVVPLAALAWNVGDRRRLATLLAAGVLVIFAVWWLFTHRIDRFLVPLWPLAALLAGIGATWNASRWWIRTLAALLVIGLVYDFSLIAGGPVADNRYLAPLDQLRAEAVAVDPWHGYLNDHADEVEKVLLVGDAQPFDLEVPAIYNTVFDSSIFEQLARDKSPDEVRRALLDRGITHVYVAWPEIERYRSPGNYGITEFIQPRVFDALVADGVLEPIAMLADSRGRMYRVIAQ